MKQQINRIKLFSELLDAEPANMDQIDNQSDLLDESMRALRIAVRSASPIAVRLALADSFIFSVQLAQLTGGLMGQECWANPDMTAGMEIFSFIQSHNIYRTPFNHCLNDLIHWMYSYASELKINLEQDVAATMDSNFTYFSPHSAIAEVSQEEWAEKGVESAIQETGHDGHDYYLTSLEGKLLKPVSFEKTRLAPPREEVTDVESHKDVSLALSQDPELESRWGTSDSSFRYDEENELHLGSFRELSALVESDLKEGEQCLLAEYVVTRDQSKISYNPEESSTEIFPADLFIISSVDRLFTIIAGKLVEGDL